MPVRKPIKINQMTFDWDQFPKSSMTRRFKKFHAENPHVFQELLRMAREARALGRDHYGINGLFEVVRWHTMIETSDPAFKINNNYAPYYARLIMKTDPSLVGFFRTRTSRADEL